MSQTITCPKCGNTFEVTEAFSHHVEEKLRSEFEKRMFAEHKLERLWVMYPGKSSYPMHEKV